MKGRNVRPEWVTRPERIILVCKEAHELITAGFIEVEGTDARKVVRFHWAPWVKADQKVLVIRQHRQQDTP